MNKMDYAAMEAGVKGSWSLLAVITGPCVGHNSDVVSVENAYFSREMCCQELRWACESDVPIIPLVRAEDKHHILNLLTLAPNDLRGTIKRLDFIHGE